MKIRFSLRQLLVVMTVCAGALAWLMWPTLTFQRFSQTLCAHEFAEANAMVDGSETVFPDGTQLPCRFHASAQGVEVTCGGGALHRTTDPAEFAAGLQPRRRILPDLLRGRRIFVDSRYRGDTFGFEFVVQRGKITVHFR